jgi:hypothetical protein
MGVRKELGGHQKASLRSSAHVTSGRVQGQWGQQKGVRGVMGSTGG